MIVTKTVGQVSYKMEGTPREIMEYEQLQEQKSLAFKTELHVKSDSTINEKELIKALNKAQLKTFGSF